ncbi:MAG: GntR family transcriptional regulator [Spirochaetia bacterium]|jgi:DNA-binding GntR family transcriptional regulator
MVDKSNSTPLWAQVEEDVENQIRAGNLKSGMKIPSEFELAAKYGISRLTVRRALERLVSKGLIFTQPGKGTFVTDHDLPYGFSAMVSFGRTLREMGHDVGTEVLDQAVIPGPAEILRTLRLDSSATVVVIRRLRFVDGAPAAIHTSYFDARIYAPLLSLDLAKESILEAAERIGGIRIAYSQESIRAIPCSSAESLLLSVETGRPLIELEGVVFDDRNVPARYTRGLYRGDMFRFDFKNTAKQTSSLAFTSIS